MIWSFRKGPKAGPNPWKARTLEWTISSPAPYYNFKKIPAVLKAPYNFGEPLPYIGIEYDTAFPHASHAEPLPAGTV
jgi:cytochrome c oxidase subunit 1